MLPEAMVCYLENYEAERFSEIFLGEFDTPEAIWSSEMRFSCFLDVCTFLYNFFYASHVFCYTYYETDPTLYLVSSTLKTL